MRLFNWIRISLLLVFILNGFSRNFLPYAYSHIISYNKLYYPDEHLRISGLSIDNDSLVMEFKGKGITDSNRFELYADSQLLERQQGPVFKIRLPAGQKQFFLRING